MIGHEPFNWRVFFQTIGDIVTYALFTAAVVCCAVGFFDWLDRIVAGVKH